MCDIFIVRIPKTIDMTNAHPSILVQQEEEKKETPPTENMTSPSTTDLLLAPRPKPKVSILIHFISFFFFID
jgi:hypothetical protein